MRGGQARGRREKRSRGKRAARNTHYSLMSTMAEPPARDGHAEGDGRLPAAPLDRAAPGRGGAGGGRAAGAGAGRFCGNRCVTAPRRRAYVSSARAWREALRVWRREGSAGSRRSRSLCFPQGFPPQPAPQSQSLKNSYFEGSQQTTLVLAQKAAVRASSCWNRGSAVAADDCDCSSSLILSTASEQHQLYSVLRVTSNSERHFKKAFFGSV